MVQLEMVVPESLLLVALMWMEMVLSIAAFASIQASPLGRTGAGEVTVVFGDGTIGDAINSAGFQPNILKIAGDQNLK